MPWTLATKKGKASFKASHQIKAMCSMVRAQYSLVKARLHLLINDGFQTGVEMTGE
jgi:hypothetical protein